MTLPPRQYGLFQPLHQNLSTLDRILTRLSAILSTTSGTDTTLCTLAYTLSLLHIRLDRRLTSRLQRIALYLAKNASDALLPGETVIATVDLLNTAVLNNNNSKNIDTTSPATTAAAAVAVADTGLISLSRLARLTASTKSAVDLLGEVRVFMRLWGLLGIYQSARRLYLQQQQQQQDATQDDNKNQHKNKDESKHDKPLTVIAWTQLLCSTVFQFLENGAYLAQRGILNTRSWTADRQARWWLWSARFWAGCVLLEGARLGRMWQLQLQVQGRRRGEGKQQGKEGEGYGDDDEGGCDGSGDALWWKDALVNTAYAPLTVHYSLPGGLVGDEYIAMLGILAGSVGFKSLWEQTKV